VNPLPLLHREIVEDDLYKRDIQQLGISAKTLDTVFQDLSFAVATKPEIFPLASGTEYRRVRIYGFGMCPDLNVWFTYNDAEAVLKRVEVFSEEC
jgi:hypothetical protein